MGSSVCGERLLGYATTEDVAEELSKGKGEWGNDGPIREQEIKIYESMEDVAEETRLKNLVHDEDLKAQAMSKLSRDEKIALGLETV